MKLTYQTAVACLIQFLAMTILGVPNTIVSIVTTCHSDGSNCVSNSIVTLLFFLLTAFWFGIILGLGYYAQHKRSPKLAWLLIGCEFMTLGVAGYINFPRDTNLLEKATSLIDAILSIWIMYLAFHIVRSGGGRVVKSSARSRNRRLED